MKSALWTRGHISAYRCVLFGPHIDIKNVNHHSKKIRTFPIQVEISASFQTSDALATLRYVFFPMSICRTQCGSSFGRGHVLSNLWQCTSCSMTLTYIINLAPV